MSDSAVPMEVGFDESAWPCAVFFEKDYAAHCQLGRQRMATKRAVLCGLARDVGAMLPGTIAALEQIGGMFADYRIVLFENDSVDDTREQLQSWQNRNPRVTLLTDTLHKPRWGPVQDVGRTRDLAFCRNQYHAWVCQHFADFDVVLVTDTDVQGWSLEGIANTFGQEGWDAVGSNGISLWFGRPIFMDVWALRTADHVEAFDYHAANLSVLTRGLPMQSVQSCFGGLALYTMEAFKAGLYEGSDCEHVTFHAAMRKAGFSRVFLNPSMIVLYPRMETLLPAAVPPWGEDPIQLQLSAPVVPPHPRSGDFNSILDMPPVQTGSDPSFELHMLLCEADVLRAHWSLASFFHYTKLRPKLVLHDDGTLSQNSLGRFRKYFRDCTIFTNMGSWIHEQLSGTPMCQYFRRQNSLARKLFDILLLSQAPYVMAMDPEVLWFAASPVIADSIRTRVPFHLDGGMEAYARNRKFMEEHLQLLPAKNCHAGVVGFPRAEFLDLAFLDEAIRKLVHIPAPLIPASLGYWDAEVEPNSPIPERTLSWGVMKQTLYALLFGRHPQTIRLNNWPGGGVAHQFPETAILSTTALIDFLGDATHQAFFRKGAEHLIHHRFLEQLAAAPSKQ